VRIAQSYQQLGLPPRPALFGMAKGRCPGLPHFSMHKSPSWPGGGARSDLGDIPAGVVGSYMGVLLVMEFFTIEAHQHPQ